MNLLLKGGIFIDWQSLDFSETDILVEEGENDEVTFVQDPKEIQGDFITIDCGGKYITKSFAIGHHHVYSALARGMPAPPKNPENFYEILKYIWWNLDKALDEKTIEASALATAMACARSGATLAIDHHASPNCISSSLNIIADAFERVGISHLLCYEITDRDGSGRAEKGLEENKRYLKNKSGLVGLHASFTVGQKTMRKAADLAEKFDTGIHIHVAEDLYDQQSCQEKYGKRVVERLNEYGILNFPKTILAHCLYLSEAERDLIRHSNAWVVENMESNLKNKVGFFNGKDLGERIMLGTDGMHSDMLQSAKAAFFVGQQFDNIDYGSAYQRFRNSHNYLKSNRFNGDGSNNLVVFDYPTPTPLTKNNFLGHFIFGLTSSDILHVISNGKLIVKDRSLQTVDEQEVLHFTHEQANRLWSKMGH